MPSAKTESPSGKQRPWLLLLGPLAILALTLVLWTIQRERNLFIPNHAVLFMAVLVIAGLTGSLASAVVNIALAVVATLFLYAQVGYLTAHGEWLIRILLPVVTFPIAGAIVFLMRRRVSRLAAAPIQAERLLFQAIMASMHDAIVETDWQGIRDVNASFCRMTGFSREELIGAKAPFPFWPIEQYATIAAALETSMRGEALDFELVLNRKNSERFPVLLSVSRILDASGSANRVLYSFREITELKRTQQQLAERERTLAQAIDAARMGTWDIDLVNRRVRWGGHMEAMWGMKPGAFDGTFEMAAAQIHPDDRASFDDMMEEARRTRAPITSQFRITWPDGTLHWLATMGAMLFNDKGEAVRMTGVMHEITDQRNAELLLSAEGRILEKIARRSSLQATLISLVQMIEEILQGSRCSILTLTEDAKRFHVAAAPTLPPEFVRLAEGFEVGPERTTCGTAASSGRRVVTRDINIDPRWSQWKDLVMAFGLRSCTSEPIRAKDGRVLGTYAVYFSEPRELTPHELHVLEVAAQLAAIAIEREREERELRDAKEAAEIANRTKDRFLNLLSHELRAPLTPILTVASVLESDNRLPEELRPDITMIRRNAEGEAALVDELIDLVHGARGQFPIEVEPNVNDVREVLRGDRQEAPVPPKVQRAKKPLRILLVEDHADTADVLNRMLARRGHHVVLAKTVAEGAEKACAEPFDLLLSDIGLPDGTGPDLLQRIRPHCTVPAIAISGFGSQQDIQRSLAAGFLLHLTKPVNFHTLHDAIERFTS
ncbi:MAG: PAS domain S-box protein [Phycisphaerae bacterium]